VAQQRRAPELGEVALVLEDEAPVRDVEDRRQRVAVQLDARAAIDRGRDQQADAEQQEQRRQQAPRAPGPEAPERDAAVLRELGDQQRRDQVAADDEEDVDAEEAAGQPAAVGVVDEHGGDGDRAEPVDPGHAAKPGACPRLRAVAGSVAAGALPGMSPSMRLMTTRRSARYVSGASPAAVAGEPSQEEARGWRA